MTELLTESFSVWVAPYDEAQVWNADGFPINLTCSTLLGPTIGCFLPPVMPAANQPTPTATVLVPIASVAG